MARRLHENGLLTIAIFSLFTASTLSVSAGERSKASDNALAESGKQIASVLGLSRPASAAGAQGSSKKAVATAKAGADQAIHSLIDGKSLAEAGKLIPPSVQEAADLGCDTARKLMRRAAINLSQCGQWLVSLEQQLNSAPVITPAGPPYITRSSRHLRLMPDGRIKTVVAN